MGSTAEARPPVQEQPEPTTADQATAMLARFRYPLRTGNFFNKNFTNKEPETLDPDFFQKLSCLN